jgi:uncharacterized protein involved in response to NO
MASPSPARKQYQGLILFERAYRTFFLGAALFAGFTIPLWVLTLNTNLEISTAFTARDYHVHEMIFGYLGAVLAGFLFTAMPNWTGRPALAGIQLALLSTLWLAGRIAVVTSAAWPVAAAVIDASFLVAIASLAWKDVIKGGSVRNMPVCLLVSLLAATNIAYDLALVQDFDTAWSLRSALAVIAVLLSLIGGRVTPNFSANWMRKNNFTSLPAPFSAFDKITIAATIITVTVWSAMPDAKITGVLFSAVFVAHMVRLLRWRGWQATAEPLVLILHIGYLWLALWFGLSALAILLPETFSPSSAVHALTSGAIGTMTMAIMTRAILGHSGRRLIADRATQTIYALIVTGAFLRVFSETLAFNYDLTVTLSGALWAGGFILFAITYGPYCLTRRKTL